MGGRGGGGHVHVGHLCAVYRAGDHGILGGRARMGPGMVDGTRQVLLGEPRTAWQGAPRTACLARRASHGMPRTACLTQQRRGLCDLGAYDDAVDGAVEGGEDRPVQLKIWVSHHQHCRRPIL
jgi:hypothetical protein